MEIILETKNISSVHVDSRKKLRIRAGDTVRVWQKIIEGKEKKRLQAFEGIVIATKHGLQPGATFTVRRVGSEGIAVEKIFPLYSPMIDKIEILKRTQVRRAKLYFLRNKTPKQVRDKLRHSHSSTESSVSETEIEKKLQTSEESKEVAIKPDAINDKTEKSAMQAEKKKTETMQATIPQKEQPTTTETQKNNDDEQKQSP